MAKKSQAGGVLGGGEAGYQWCPTCQANYQGPMCPGCSPEAPAEDQGAGPSEGQGEGPFLLPPVLGENEVLEITETLKVPLTDADYKEYGIKMGQANREIQQAEDELAAVKSQFKSRIDAAVAKRNEYAAIINAGCEYKPVDCHLVKNFRENSVTVIRLDTGEVVRTHTMSANERQRGLGFPTP